MNLRSVARILALVTVSGAIGGVLVLCVTHSSRPLRMNRLDRLFYLDLLECSYGALMDYQVPYDTLPRVEENGDFRREYFPYVFGRFNNTAQVLYANDPSLRFDLAAPEVIVVVIRAEEKERSLHLLTSHSRVIQSRWFEPELWDETLVGSPLPCGRFAEFVCTNLKLSLLVE